MADKVELDTKEWNDFLSKMKGKLGDISKYLIAGANTFGFSDVIDHFSKEEGPDGGWKDRKDLTNKRYDIMGGSHRSSNKLLQLTGRLRGSLLPNAGQVRRKDKLSVEMVTNVEYAHRHDAGTFGMPKREFLWLSDKAKGLMLDLIMDKLVDEGAA